MSQVNPKKNILEGLVVAGVHYGHKSSSCNPLMKEFMWGMKNGIALIDVSKTAFHLGRAEKFLETVAAQGKTILWIGTKKSAQAAIRTAGETLKNPFVDNRWIGGTFTNKDQVKKLTTKMLHYEDILRKSDESTHYTKKELSAINKLVGKFQKNVGGIRNLTFPVGAIVVVDVKKEQAAVREASMMNIPVVALVDTNSDPSLVDYVIPGNDDSARSVQLIITHLTEAVARGQQKCASDKKAREAEAVAAAAELEAVRGKEIAQQVDVLAKEVAESEVKKGGKRGAARGRNAQSIEEVSSNEQKK